MSITSVLDAFTRIAEKVEKAKPTSVDAPKPSDDEIADIEEPRARALVSMTHDAEVSSCLEALENITHPVEPGPHITPVYAIDGSTRLLDSSRLQLAVYAVAASYYDGGFVVGVYPGDGVNPYLDLTDTPVASLGPRTLDPEADGVYTKPIVDPVFFAKGLKACPKHCTTVLERLGYATGFDHRTMLDENRVLAETDALSYVVSIAERGSLVLIDGPLYPTPGLYVGLEGIQPSFASLRDVLRAYYALSYLVNTAYRLQVLRRALGDRIAVAGVVKRIGSSKHLVYALRSICGEVYASRDLELVDQLRGQASPLAIGPFYTHVNHDMLVARIGGLLGDINKFTEGLTTRPQLSKHKLSSMAGLEQSLTGNIIPKKSYYLVVPGWRTTILRIELPCPPAANCGLTLDAQGQLKPAGSPRDVFEADKDILSTIAWLLLYPETQTVPTPIAIADHAAGRLARSLLLTGYTILRDRVSFTYETLLAVHGAHFPAG